MTTQACYEQIKADYRGVLSRMGGSDKMVKKFALRFLDDKTAEQLFESCEREDYEEGFRLAHTLKGVCLNLGFKTLFDSSSELTEALRGGQKPGGDILERVKADYEEIIAALKNIDE